MSARIYSIAYYAKPDVKAILERITKEHTYDGYELFSEILSGGGFRPAGDNEGCMVWDQDYYDLIPVEHEGKQYYLYVLWEYLTDSGQGVTAEPRGAALLE